MSPLVSIIMATYNRGHLIEETIGSILSQIYTQWECIIIDDGSSDGTKEIVSGFSEKDNRIKYFQREKKYKKGLPGCRNMGLDLAVGDYIVFFDDDDIAHPDNLQICTEILISQQVDYCRYERKVFWGEFSVNFDRTRSFQTSPLYSNVINDMLTQKIPYNSCQVMWKNHCFSEERFCEDLMYAEEWECYSRILMGGAIGINVHKVLFYGRKHAESNTGQFNLKNPVRKKSHFLAIKMVTSNLKEKQLLATEIVDYFIRIGLQTRDYNIVSFVLRRSDQDCQKRIKYHLGYFIYPFLKPLFRIKKRFSST